VWLKRLRKKSICLSPRLPAAKADIENRAIIAALKRCATQNQGQNRVFPQTVKPRLLKQLQNPNFSAGGEVATFQKTSNWVQQQ
jgi:hypothetical protein